MKTRKYKKSNKDKITGQLSIDFLSYLNINIPEKEKGKVIYMNSRKNKSEKLLIKYILEHTKSY